MLTVQIAHGGGTKRSGCLLPLYPPGSGNVLRLAIASVMSLPLEGDLLRKHRLALRKADSSGAGYKPVEKEGK